MGRKRVWFSECELVIGDVLREFGLEKGTAEMYQGGMSDVYPVPGQNIALRFSGWQRIGEAAWHNIVETMKYTWTLSNASGVAAHVEYFRSEYHNSWSYGFVGEYERAQDRHKKFVPNMIVTIIEWLPGAIECPDWGALFGRDEELIFRALFDVSSKLVNAGVVHGDMSPNNLLVFPDRSMKFIDLDNLCVTKTDAPANVDIFCTDYTVFTPGFTLPENVERASYTHNAATTVQSMIFGMLGMTAEAASNTIVQSHIDVERLLRTPRLRELQALMLNPATRFDSLDAVGEFMGYTEPSLLTQAARAIGLAQSPISPVSSQRSVLHITAATRASTRPGSRPVSPAAAAVRRTARRRDTIMTRARAVRGGRILRRRTAFRK